MINNELRLIGTIITDFIASDPVNEKYVVKIEVERKYGKPMNCDLTVSKKNYLIDVTKSLLGKLVIVNGYLDVNNGGMTMVVQNIMVVGKNE